MDVPWASPVYQTKDAWFWGKYFSVPLLPFSVSVKKAPQGFDSTYFLEKRPPFLTPFWHARIHPLSWTEANSPGHFWGNLVFFRSRNILISAKKNGRCINWWSFCSPISGWMNEPFSYFPFNAIKMLNGRGMAGEKVIPNLVAVQGWRKAWGQQAFRRKIACSCGRWGWEGQDIYHRCLWCWYEATLPTTEQWPVVPAVLGKSGSNMQLAQAIRQGTLDEHPTLHALVSMVIAKAKMVNMGHTSRFTASKCKGVDAGALEELAFTLTLCTGRNSLFRFCGLNPRTLGFCHMDVPTLPCFLAPSHAEMVLNIEKVLQLLGCKGTRDYNREAIARVLSFTNQYFMECHKSLVFVAAQASHGKFTPRGPDKLPNPEIRRISLVVSHLFSFLHLGEMMQLEKYCFKGVASITIM